MRYMDAPQSSRLKERPKIENKEEVESIPGTGGRNS